MNTGPPAHLIWSFSVAIGFNGIAACTMTYRRRPSCLWAIVTAAVAMFSGGLLSGWLVAMLAFALTVAGMEPLRNHLPLWLVMMGFNATTIAGIIGGGWLATKAMWGAMDARSAL